MREGRRVARIGARCAVSTLAVALLLGALACDVEQKVVRLRPPAVHERANLPEAPKLEQVSQVVRYPDGAYSVDGLLKEASKLIGEEVRVKGYVREVNICDVEKDATCTDPPHAYIVDDPKRPKRAMLVVGGLDTKLPKLVPGQGENLNGVVEQISPDGRFVRTRGILVLPKIAPPPAPEAGPADSPASGETKPQ